MKDDTRHPVGGWVMSAGFAGAMLGCQDPKQGKQRRGHKKQAPLPGDQLESGVWHPQSQGRETKCGG